jgi:hypothetical protein
MSDAETFRGGVRLYLCVCVCMWVIEGAFVGVRIELLNCSVRFVGLFTVILADILGLCLLF